jgi:thiol-disulfide isomerase/thioredoxin
VLPDNITEYAPQALAEFEFTDGEGKLRNLEEFENKVILLNFWATWCTSCVVEMGELDNLQKFFRKKPFQVIGLSQDFKGAEQVKKFFTANKIVNLEIFHDPGNKIFRSLNIAGLPTAILINGEGKAVAELKGKVDYQSDEVKALIMRYIKPLPPSKVLPQEEPSKPILPPAGLKPKTERDVPEHAITTIPGLVKPSSPPKRRDPQGPSRRKVNDLSQEVQVQ